MKRPYAMKVLLWEAFVDSLPVCMGYVAMGFAAGVLLALKGNVDAPVFWGAFSSGLCISGPLQFAMVDWIRSGTALWYVAVLTFCLNIRYAMYGLALLERFAPIPRWQRWYLIWALTDETYALEVGNKTRQQDFIPYCLSLSAMNHSYWVLGVMAGAWAGSMDLPFSTDGVDFAMTALFLVILTDQWRNASNRLPALLGGGIALGCLLVFGVADMLLPTLVLLLAVVLGFRHRLGLKEAANHG